MLKKLVRVFGRAFSAREVPELGRNEPCHCGSGRKYKRCCIEKDATARRTARDEAASANAGYIGGRATVGNRALENANRYRRPKS